jgi:hypothetical protein
MGRRGICCSAAMCHPGASSFASYLFGPLPFCSNLGKREGEPSAPGVGGPERFLHGLSAFEGWWTTPQCSGFVAVLSVTSRKVSRRSTRSSLELAARKSVTEGRIRVACFRMVASAPVVSQNSKSGGGNPVRVRLSPRASGSLRAITRRHVPYRLRRWRGQKERNSSRLQVSRVGHRMSVTFLPPKRRANDRTVEAGAGVRPSSPTPRYRSNRYRITTIGRSISRIRG